MSSIDVDNDVEYTNPSKNQEWVDFFSNLKVFRGWNKESIKEILRYSKVCKFKPKQLMLGSSRSSTDIYVIKSGQVLVWTQIKRNTNSRTSNRILLNPPPVSDKLMVDLNNCGLSQNNSYINNSESFGNDSRSKISKPTTKFSYGKYSRQKEKRPDHFGGKLETTTSKFSDSSFHLPEIQLGRSSSVLSEKRHLFKNWDNFFQNQTLCYLEIAKLKRGDVFGLDPELFKTHPNCQLISDGCECFIVNRDVFLMNSPLDFKDIIPYQYNQEFPTKEEIDTKYNEFFKWKMYRKKVFQDTTIQQIRKRLPQFR